MGKLMVVVTRFLPLCAVLLVLPAVARAVPLLTRDTTLSGTTVAQRPELAGAVVENKLIPYSFQGAGFSVSGVIKNRVVRSVDGTLDFYWRIIPDASSNGAITAFRVGGFDGFTLDGDFRLDGPGSVGPDTARNFGDGFVNFLFSDGVSAGESSLFFFLDTQATAFSNTGTYDLLCADNGCISPQFTTFAPAAAQPLAPGWYKNSGPGTFYEDGSWRIVWKRSYVYPYPGDVPLYWYAQVKYRNIGSQTLSISCSGGTDLPPVREHIRDESGYLGYVDAEETFCDRNPGWTGSVKPGEAYYDWAIFHNVPGLGDEVSLEWAPYGSSPWVDPWYSPLANVPPPAECPPELVTHGTCQPVSKEPEGKAPNLIVLVHGCCTDANDVRNDWYRLGRLIARTIRPPGAWEIVVWDWHDYTPKREINLSDVLQDPRDAYENILKYPYLLYLYLANVIANHHYQHIHLIGHSSGAKLIQLTAEELVRTYKTRNEAPFIHLTFLDAYTRDNMDRLTYGFLPDYPNHYSEHYVDIGLPSTDAILQNSFNFDITNWEHSPEEDGFFGHHWPIYWYIQGITTSGFRYGYPLSLEGGGGIDRFNELASKWPASDPPKPCILENETTENPPSCDFMIVPSPTPVPTPTPP